MVGSVCVAAGCGSSSSTGTPPPDTTVAAVHVSALSQPLLVGANTQLTATVTNAAGSPLTRTVIWASSDASVATVGADGTVEALSAGTTTVSASVDNKSGSTGVTVNNLTPVVSGISPASVAAGAPAQTLTVSGSGFAASSVVHWNGTALTTTFVSNTRLTAQLPAGDVVTAGASQVTVFTPAPGGGTSSAATFTVSAAGNNPVPAITSIGPTSIQAGGAGFTLAISGSNFISTSTVQWNGSSRPTTFVDATHLTAQIGAADIAAAATVPVTVVNSAPGGGTSAAQSFIVFASLPIQPYAQLPAALVEQVNGQLLQTAADAATNIGSPGLQSPGAGSFRLTPSGGGMHGIPSTRLRPARSAGLRQSGNCPAISPANASVNAAGLPQSPVTYNFILADCIEDQYTSQEGVVMLSDPTPVSSAYNYDLTVTNYRSRLGDSTFTINDLINAVDSIRNPTPGSVSEWLTETQDLTETGPAFGHLVENLVLHTVYTYSSSAGLLVYNNPMFAGTIVIDQTVTFVVDPGNNFGTSGTIIVQTTTPTPLVFDATCQSDTPYSSGVLQNVIAGRTTTTTYHGCNVPPTIQ